MVRLRVSDDGVVAMVVTKNLLIEMFQQQLADKRIVGVGVFEHAPEIPPPGASRAVPVDKLPERFRLERLDDLKSVGAERPNTGTKLSKCLPEVLVDREPLFQPFCA